MLESSAATVPKGRGAKLYAALLEKRKAQELKTNVDNTSTEVSRPSGRGRATNIAKLLKMHKELRQSSASVLAPSSSNDNSQIVETEKNDILSNEKKLANKLTEMEISEPVIKRAPVGKTDQLIPATANYIRLNVESDKGVFEYEVQFEPAVDSFGLRKKLLFQVLDGSFKTFDGVILYLPVKLEEERNCYDIEHPESQKPLQIRIIYKRKRHLGECTHLYNILFKQIFKILRLVEIGRQHFDPTSLHRIVQHRLEIWPGYISSVDEYEDGVMLCIDCSHRVLRTDTVRNFLGDMRAKFSEQDTTKMLVGCSVLTKYNNRTYRIDDILWKESPLSTFTSVSGEEVSYVDYYRHQYGIIIKDVNQPLLLHRVQRKKSGSLEKVDGFISLIPELSYMTGLTDSMRNDDKLMKDVAAYTRVTPAHRITALKKFINNVRNSEEATQLLKSWGLSIAEGTIDLEMRILAPETILFGENTQHKSNELNADWSRAATNNPLLCPIDLINWVIIYTNRDSHVANEFRQTVLQVCKNMGMTIAPPKMHLISNDSTSCYADALSNLIHPHIQMLVIICPTQRDDRYNLIKKITLCDKPIPSQVIMGRTLSKPNRLRSIVQKIVLQMNCKLGGQLWSVKLPPRHQWMICGIDTYHDAQRSDAGKLSVSAFVASLNEAVTRWYSKVNFQKKGEELMHSLRILFTMALKKYFQVNGQWPKHIIIYRDGVGDGQLNCCKEYEIEQLKQAIRATSPDSDNLPKITFIVVQKRINTRLFWRKHNKSGMEENPPPGSVMDHTITRRNWYDFFLISHGTRGGTVTPTHYLVLEDNSQLKIEQVQKLTYKMCHLYYNWAGTIRVPAPCQYAHKLAYLIGQNVHKLPDEKLADRLFYL